MIFFFFQAEDGIRDLTVTGVQTCALPISSPPTCDRGTSSASSRAPSPSMSCRARLPPTSKARSPAARWCVSTDAAPASYPRVGYGAAGPPARAAYRISAPFRGPVMSQRSVSAGTRLREAVQAERPLQVVRTIDAYAALLAQNAGLRAIYLSGAGGAHASFGLPDLRITSLN